MGGEGRRTRSTRHSTDYQLLGQRYVEGTLQQIWFLLASGWSILDFTQTKFTFRNPRPSGRIQWRRWSNRLCRFACRAACVVSQVVGFGIERNHPRFGSTNSRLCQWKGRRLCPISRFHSSHPVPSWIGWRSDALSWISAHDRGWVALVTVVVIFVGRIGGILQN